MGGGVLDTQGDGRPSLSPNSQWIVTDIYLGRDRKRSLILYDIFNQKLHIVGKFFSGWQFDGTNRCGLHPRWSPDGNWIAIDSANTGRRGLYFIDLKGIIADSPVGVI